LTDTAEHCVLFLFSSNANKTEEKKRKERQCATLRKKSQFNTINNQCFISVKSQDQLV